MKSFGAEGMRVEEIRRMLLLGLVDPAHAHPLADELCKISRLQEQKVIATREHSQDVEAKTTELMYAIDVLRHRWRSSMNEVELDNLLHTGLREAELGRAAQWRTLLLGACLPSERS